MIVIKDSKTLNKIKHDLRFAFPSVKIYCKENHVCIKYACMMSWSLLTD